MYTKGGGRRFEMEGAKPLGVWERESTSGVQGLEDLSPRPPTGAPLKNF